VSSRIDVPSEVEGPSSSRRESRRRARGPPLPLCSRRCHQPIVVGEPFQACMTAEAPENPAAMFSPQAMGVGIATHSPIDTGIGPRGEVARLHRGVGKEPECAHVGTVLFGRVGDEVGHR